MTVLSKHVWFGVDATTFLPWFPVDLCWARACPPEVCPWSRGGFDTHLVQPADDKPVGKAGQCDERAKKQTQLYKCIWYSNYILAWFFGPDVFTSGSISHITIQVLCVRLLSNGVSCVT